MYRQIRYSKNLSVEDAFISNYKLINTDYGVTSLCDLLHRNILLNFLISIQNYGV